jgi:ABC-type glycerol-3-phosphate transport system substrate-binding protein
VASYSRKYGKDSISEFRSGLGNFNSPQNGFLTGSVAMEQQGPWMANYIEDLAPQMNRWHVADEQLAREKHFEDLQIGMTRDQVTAMLGNPTLGQSASPTAGPPPQILTFDAGIKRITVTFKENQLSEKHMTLLPAKVRRALTQWAAAPYPAIDSMPPNTAFADFDTLIIPRTAKHKQEAFEFIAFVNRQDVMESLCSMHCKNSPLDKVSPEFIENHPNPYIQVFEDCARSQGAFGVPQVSVWPEVSDEMVVASQKCYMLEQTAPEAMAAAQKRLTEKWDFFRQVQQARVAEASR